LYGRACRTLDVPERRIPAGAVTASRQRAGTPTEVRPLLLMAVRVELPRASGAAARETMVDSRGP
jgi:hypothetical protein